MVVAPATYEEAADALREAAAAGKRVRFRGGGTKLGWGNPVPDADLEISTEALDGVVEHNAGDLTAVVQAGVRMAQLRDELAAKGQMLALDPPLGEADRATIGGVVASGDSGPLRHRYGGPRDLVLGMTVALADGTVARTGGKVIKNVAGYDLAKLFAGSFGTLGMILEVAVRLHPLPRRAATAVGTSPDPAAVASAGSALAHSQLEAERLDVTWTGATAMVLAEFAGNAAAERAADAAGLMRRTGLEANVRDDGDFWGGVRSLQRAPESTVVRVSGVQRQLEAQLRAAIEVGSSMVARAASGLAWIALPAQSADGVERLRRDLAPSPCVALDAPAEVRNRVPVWGNGDGGSLGLMRQVKARFDPAGTCNPGVFVGGI